MRVLTRDPARASGLEGDLVEIVTGDVRDPASLRSAAAGVATVVSAVHGFAGADVSPRSVDCDGIAQLIAESRRAGVEHVVLVSVYGAHARHRMELFRMKYLAEQALKESTLAWTIVRPTPFMETWLELVGRPAMRGERTVIFGHGENPINFVSVSDVACVIELAVVDPALRLHTIDVGGPENLTMRQFVERAASVSGQTPRVWRVPRPAMRVMVHAMRPVNSSLARQIAAGVVMDTVDMTFDQRTEVPGLPSSAGTPLAEVVRRERAGSASAPTGYSLSHWR